MSTGIPDARYDWHPDASALYPLRSGELLAALQELAARNCTDSWVFARIEAELWRRAKSWALHCGPISLAFLTV